jgi:hypothetical protein
MKKKKIPCEIYSRVVGYLRPVRFWNVSKKQEFEDRVVYRVSEEVRDASKPIPRERSTLATAR